MDFQLSRKQLEAFQKSDARLSIFEGSVRSGKTFISLLRFVDFCRNGPPGDLMMCGRTDRTILRNMINGLHELFGSSINYLIGRGIVQIFGRDCHVVSCSDARAENKIRGSTLAGALVDEASLLEENFLKMLMSRLSIEGAQCFMTTNPDSPGCYIKKDLIDRKDELDCKVFSFRLDDNPVLSEEYKKNIMLEYTGLFAERFIWGKWVQAEGAVYQQFTSKDHVISHPPGPATEYILGVDYGITNPQTYALIGINRSCYPNIWLEREYYYDSKKRRRQKTDAEYAQDLKEFLQGIQPSAIYVDPSAASFKQELLYQDFRNVMDADNKVLDGIRFVSQLLSNGTFKICENCTQSIEEFQGYCWDSKASRQGKDQVIKQYDHLMDAIRYGLFTHLFKSKLEGGMSERDALELENRYANFRV